MSIPRGFQFSQGSLQDYADCRRRFYLRYLLRLAWPGVEAEPILENERYLKQGSRFHQMIQQNLLGIPEDRLSQLVQDEDLERWWQNFRTGMADLKEGSNRRYAEVDLRASLGEFDLVAKCDLVRFWPDGRVQIYDWKTSRRRPKRDWLASRLQTRVYPYLLVRGGAYLNNGRVIRPEEVEMIYWFADFPNQPECFSYDVQKYQADEAYLRKLIEEIDLLQENDFRETGRPELSRFCVYRSLCGRGVEAGRLEEIEAEAEANMPELDFDFEQIAEIEF